MRPGSIEGDIVGCVPRGSGASIVHRSLAENVPGYSLREYDPRWEYAPWAMPLIRPSRRAHLIHTTPDHAIFLHRSAVPMVVTFHGFFLDAEIRPYSTPIQQLHYSTDLRWFTKAALKRATAVTAVSEFVADMVRKELGYDGEIEVIYNGVDTARFAPGLRRETKEIKVLFSGNLTRRKGAELLPKIAALLPSNIKILYTRGLRSRNILPQLPNLQDLHSVPHVEMPNLYRNVDIVLIPSVREGFSLATAEAMASGLPVVATDGSALPELIVNSKGGFLCRLGNAQQFADSIKILASSPEMRSGMGAFNRSWAEEKFALSIMIEKYRRLFASYR